MQNNFHVFPFLLFVLLLPGQEVGPVEEVEDSEDTRKQNPRENIDLLGGELEVRKPGCYQVCWHPDE